MPPCVLIVDDDSDIREAMAEVLRDAGYDVRTAAHGADALVDMRACQPCIVILDLMMPIMDGWTVVNEMRADPSLSQVPVCVVSAATNKAPPASACVIPKPIRLERLLAAVESSCGPAS